MLKRLRFGANQEECGHPFKGASGECCGLCKEQVDLYNRLQACPSAEGLEPDEALEPV